MKQPSVTGFPLSSVRRSSANSEGGFTLIELSFVALLLALLGSIIYGSVTTLVRTKNTLESGRVAERTAEALLTRISRELENRSAQPLRARDGRKGRALPPPDTSGGDNSDDEAEESASLLLGTSRKVGGIDADSLRFITIGNPASAEMGNPGLIEVEYRLEKAGNGPFQSNRERPLFNLVREEAPADVQDRRVFESRTFEQVLSDRVSSLQFRYRFNRKWVNQWSSRRESFPDAVEVTLVLAAENGGTESYRTAVALYRNDE